MVVELIDPGDEPDISKEERLSVTAQYADGVIFSISFFLSSWLNLRNLKDIK